LSDYRSQEVSQWALVGVISGLPIELFSCLFHVQGHGMATVASLLIKELEFGTALPLDVMTGRFHST